jgi:hypothetical protein
MGPLDTQYLVKHCQDIIEQAQPDGAAMVDLKITH